ncbi:MAG: FecR domain-containing protein [Kiritimatiellae bacterium]|jgi:hypothetical protein|nr:FecR domain-containing protein [Kiritimatiellia bacterium]
MTRADGYFEELLMRVLEGVASEQDFITFTEIIRRDEGLRRRYAREMYVQALLGSQGGTYASSVGMTVHTEAEGDRLLQGVSRGMPWWRRRPVWAAAAALMVLAGGAHMLAVRQQLPTAPYRAERGRHEPGVQRVRQADAIGLSLPVTLPGELELAEGEATVRLSSGVELTLCGATRVMVIDAMRIDLASGRVLAHVPHWATGFIVRTMNLEAWDLGTVFGVAVSNTVSELFVFKGSVQVNDASGGGVGLCEEGEGVFASGDSAPVKVAADWSEAEQRFATVRGLGARTRASQAFEVSGRIIAGWIDRYMPEAAWRVRERYAHQAALRKEALRAQMRKMPWVPPNKTETTPDASAARSPAAAQDGPDPYGASPVRGTSRLSAPVLVDVSPRHNRRWMTVFSREVPLQWSWPDGAMTATLSLKGLRSSVQVTVARPVSQWEWQAFDRAAPDAEDVVEASLSFYGESAAPLSVWSARLAVLPGAFAAAPVMGGVADRLWSRVKNEAVVPYDAEWLAETAGAPAGTLAIAKAGAWTVSESLPGVTGYVGLSLRQAGWGYGDFALSLVFADPQGEWTAGVYRRPDGTLVGIR